jgi:hypothetical protein
MRNSLPCVAIFPRGAGRGPALFPMRSGVSTLGEGSGERAARDVDVTQLLPPCGAAFRGSRQMLCNHQLLVERGDSWPIRLLGEKCLTSGRFPHIIVLIHRKKLGFTLACRLRAQLTNGMVLTICPKGGHHWCSCWMAARSGQPGSRERSRRNEALKFRFLRGSSEGRPDALRYSAEASYGIERKWEAPERKFG